VPPERAERIEHVLTVLDVTSSIASLTLPGLHPLKGERKGEWAVTITGNWRIVFRIVGGHVCDVDYLDYH
jgi:toxin HigB-1